MKYVKYKLYRDINLLEYIVVYIYYSIVYSIYYI